MKLALDDQSVVLFQGDSITDAGRNRGDPDDLGAGYVMMAASWLSARLPEKRLRFLNRGIGGNRVGDLEARWQTDCIELRPDWVSIMIGINDTWRRYDSGDETPVESFERSYRAILKRTREQLEARLILIEPFVLPVPADRRLWREDLDPKIQVVRDLAREFGAILVPMDGVMNAAGARREPSFWAQDGVHPTPAGHMVMALAWLRAVGAMA